MSPDGSNIVVGASDWRHWGYAQPYALLGENWIQNGHSLRALNQTSPGWNLMSLVLDNSTEAAVPQLKIGWAGGMGAIEFYTASAADAAAAGKFPEWKDSRGKPWTNGYVQSVTWQ